MIQYTTGLSNGTGSGIDQEARDNIEVIENNITNINADYSSVLQDITNVENLLQTASNTIVVNKTAHGLLAGQAAIPSETTSTLARANAEATARRAVIVEKVINANSWQYKESGIMDTTGWSVIPPDGEYYLSETDAGQTVTTVPTTPGSWEKVMYKVEDGVVTAISKPAEQLIDDHTFTQALKLAILLAHPAPVVGHVLYYYYAGEGWQLFPDGTKKTFDVTTV